jgi:dTDP-4-dehydrorhamnose 3,5-epimerase
VNASVTAPTGRFHVQPLGLQGLVVVQRQRLADARGSLSRLFCAQELATAGWVWPVAQINHTVTLRRGAVRGMHYQSPPHAEAKLVSCLRGAVWDVAVDLRRGSPTFLRHCALELSADNGTALLIPPGFAHGFQALSDGVELLYLHSADHAPGFEAGLHPQDPALAVAWPLEVTQLSERDRSHPFIQPIQPVAFEGITLS